MKNINEIDMLINFSNLINSASDIFSITSNIKQYYRGLKEFNILFYDYSSKKLKDVINNFSPIEDMYDETAIGVLYSNFLKLSNCDFIIDNKEYYKLSFNEEISSKTLLIPLKMANSIYGMIELRFNENKVYNYKFINALNIFANQLLLFIQNTLLKEKLQLNYDFYDSLKNIAKIIETQYELNYIIPLIGEMIDKFVSNHLIYIFIKNGSEYKLFWPMN